MKRRKALAESIRRAKEFGPVYTRDAAAIRSGGMFPGAQFPGRPPRNQEKVR